ncbi:MAG TPA: D-alanyl-D-alanine carboxypeptidase/D-alanyl-D-alanine-endopeptidase [Candidatus Baltobacteraceae bacterium]|jgi:D-alanyl-D-alanine carboxypeptidase/D-alanyl-D-alanine-endopeptidase (penicillin-binding protein 4)|nr:D-alanyl-D-alanine carboxypeptidase/D-alanyl-D-alanine-endopeptidase [Candidatus Baltobacteraceae bacterium]
MKSTFTAVFALVAFGLASIPGSAQTAGDLPPGVKAIVHKPRYAQASWYMLVTDLATGRTVYQLTPDRLAFTGSVRKLFSVGSAMNALGASHRFVTPVYRRGAVDAQGTLHGNLVLVAAGDLTFGGRLLPGGGVAFTDFDHNDANNLGTAILTPQDPLYGLNSLARQVRASGIRSVHGDVVVDDRLFDSYRVPNGNLLITPIMIDENMVDVWVTPGKPGEPARVDWRPKTAAFSVRANVKTVAAGTQSAVELSNNGRAECNWPAPCVGTVSGTIPVGYKAPLSGSPTFVGTFRVEQPASFARIAFVQALERAGVRVTAPVVAPNASALLGARGAYSASDRVAQFVSPPFSEFAKLILKVSLNLGANLSLSLFGLTQGERTLHGSLAAERRSLIAQGVRPADFDFPTNGSGSPDSRAAARATVRWLTVMSQGANAKAFRDALPVLGVDGSIAGTGRDLPARGHVFAKTGTTVEGGALKAQVLAGYIDTKSGKHFAFALYVNNAGPLKSIEDVGGVFEDEAAITNAIYENN